LESDDAIELSLDDVDVRRQEKEGLAVANQGEVTVALDLHVTDELELEGLAREIVHSIQETRKKLDFSVSDRISLTIYANSKLADATRNHADYISGETLAEEVVVNALDSQDATTTVCGHECFIEVKKV
jgi:isoleucyl-tRNA synthetase